MSLFQKQNKDSTELFIEINRYSSVYIYVLAFWSYDYESSISMTQVAKMTIRQKIHITLLNVINVVTYTNYRFRFLAPFDTLHSKQLTFLRIDSKELTVSNLSWRYEFEFSGLIQYGHFGGPSHRNGRFAVYLECKNVDVVPGFRHFVIGLWNFS